MKRYRIFLSYIFVIVLTLLFASPSMASEKTWIDQSLKHLEQQEYNLAVQALEEALMLLREKALLELNNLFFTQGEASGFGLYHSRDSHQFMPGETFFLYAEPKNYTLKTIENGLYEIHIKEDIYILDMGGQILWGQKDFLDYHLVSRAPNTEIFISSKITQDSPFPKGEYQFLVVLKDVFSQKTTEKLIPFTIQ